MFRTYLFGLLVGIGSTIVASELVAAHTRRRLLSSVRSVSL